jgi:hypothetical protein
MGPPKQEHPSLAAHLHNEGFRRLGLETLEGGPEFRKYVQSYSPDEHMREGPAASMNHFMVMKYGFPMVPVYDITCHDIAVLGADGKRHEAIYAYAYWRPGDTDAPEYLCVGPTYTSQDGEYRAPIMLGTSFMQTYDNPAEGVVQGVFSATETWVMDRVTSGDLRIDVTAYPRSQSRLADRCNELRLSIKMLTLQVIKELTHPTCAIHINPSIREAIAVLTGDSGFTIAESARADVGLAHHIKTLLIGSIGRTLQVGQKLIPATVDDITRVGDIRCKVWREIWISERASDLTLSGRCAHFPYFNQWFAARGTDKYVCENDAMLNKYGMSTAAAEAMKKLQEARLDLLAGEGLLKHPKMQALDYEIHQGQQFAEKNIIISEVTIVTSVQHTGETLGSFAKRLGGTMPPSWTDESWIKLAFDALYGALVLHDLSCHGDLHMQNLTITNARPSGGCVLYAASKHGQKDAFVVPYPGRSLSIIDFSRSIINPRMQAVIASEQGSEQATTLFREQAFETLATAERWMPNYAQNNQEAIKGAALAHPQRAYEAICFVDFLAVAQDFLSLRELGAKVGDDVITACNRLKRSAQRELLRRLKQLVAGDDVTPARDASVELLHEFAPQWLFAASKMRDQPPINAFYAEVPLTYSGRNVESYPEWATPADLLKHSPGKEISDIFDRGSAALYAALRARLEGDEELELDIERIRGTMSEAPPPDAGGSWLR